MLPNFLVIGAEKSATTWLYKRLKEHPDVFLPDTKEVHFFNKYHSNLEEKDNYEDLGLDWYTNFFSGYNGEQAVGEATPMYLCDPYAPPRIKEILGEVKLIAVLRNPIDRAYSHYWMAKAKEHTNLTFAEVVEQKTDKFIKRGLYYKQLKRYYEYFNKEDILVVLFEDIINNSEQTLTEIYNFLDVDEDFIPPGLENRENSSGQYRSLLLFKLISTVTEFFRRKIKLGFIIDLLKKLGLTSFIKELNKKEMDYPEMDKSLRQELVNYYKGPNQKLASLLKKDLSHWND